MGVTPSMGGGNGGPSAQYQQRRMKKHSRKFGKVVCGHSELKPYARGLCRQCQMRFGRKPAWACPHTDVAMYALGMCKKCHKRQLRRKEIMRLSGGNPDLIHETRGRPRKDGQPHKSIFHQKEVKANDNDNLNIDIPKNFVKPGRGRPKGSTKSEYNSNQNNLLKPEPGSIAFYNNPAN